jgi:hypothetical protein
MGAAPTGQSRLYLALAANEGGSLATKATRLASRAVSSVKTRPEAAKGSHWRSYVLGSASRGPPGAMSLNNPIDALLVLSFPNKSSRIPRGFLSPERSAPIKIPARVDGIQESRADRVAKIAYRIARRRVCSPTVPVGPSKRGPPAPSPRSSARPWIEPSMPSAFLPSHFSGTLHSERKTALPRRLPLPLRAPPDDPGPVRLIYVVGRAQHHNLHDTPPLVGPRSSSRADWALRKRPSGSQRRRIACHSASLVSILAKWSRRVKVSFAR